MKIVSYTGPISEMAALESAPASLPLSLELEISKQGFGLSDSPEDDEIRSLIVCLLQHFSKKPWLLITLDEDTFLDNLAEWEILTSELQHTSLQFLSDLREIQLQQVHKKQLEYEPVFSIFHKYFKKQIKVMQHTVNMDGAWSTELLWESSTTRTMDEQLEVTSLIRLPRSASSLSSGFYFRLIAPIELLFPTPFQQASELIDQLNRFKIIQHANVPVDPVPGSNKVGSSTQNILFQIINEKLDSLNNCHTFEAIFHTIFKPDAPTDVVGDKFFTSKLLDLEDKLTDDEKQELRIELINLASAELFFPLRSRILEEKADFEQSAAEMAERRQRIGQDKEQIQSLVKSAEQDLKQIEKNQEQFNQELIKRRSELVQLQELQAFYEFVTSLNNFTPESAQNVLNQLQKLPSHLNEDNLPSFEWLFPVFGLETNPLLEARLARKIRADKTLIVDTISKLRDLPSIQWDDNGTALVVRGNNLVLSNLLSTIYEHIELRRIRSVQEIRILLNGNLVIDTNIDKKSVISGKNLVLVAENIIVGKPKILIDVSGEDAREDKVRKAEDGALDGFPGITGANGDAGSNGGSVHIEALASFTGHQNIQVNCQGGNGARGQDGGHGKKGRDGDDGEHATPYPEPSWGQSYFNEFRFIARGTRGKPGEEGGNGGKGGYGGQGGKSGQGKLVSPGFATKEFKFGDGSNGDDGNSGNNGKSGTHGSHGKDHGWGKEGFWCNSEGKWGYNLYSRTISNWTWTGYQILEGSKPDTQTVLQNENNKQEVKRSDRKKSSQLNKINQIALNQHKQTLLSSRVGGSKTNMTTELQATAKAQMVKASLNDREIKKKFEQMKQQKSQVQAKLNSSKGQLSKLEAVYADAETAERQAQMKAQELEKMANDLKERQREAKQQTLISQSISKKQIVQNRLADSSRVEGDESVQTQKSHFKASSSRVGEADKTEEVVKYLQKVSQGLSVELQDRLEACLQNLLMECGRLSSESKEVIRDACHRVKNKECEFVDYIKNGQLTRDLVICEKSEGKSTLDLQYGHSSLIKLTWNIRTGKIPQNFNWEYATKRSTESEEFNDHMKELESDFIFKKVLQEWVKGKTMSWSNFKSKFGSNKETDLAIVQAQLLKSARVLHQEIILVFGDSFSETLDSFLKRFVKNLNSVNEKSDPEVQMMEFIKNLEGFSFQGIRDTLQQSGSDDETNLLRVNFVYSKLRTTFDLKQLDLIRNEVQNSAAGRSSKNQHHHLDLLRNNLESSYKVILEKEGVIEQMKGKAGGVAEILEGLITYEQMVESKYANLTFERRIELYKEMESQLNAHRSVDAVNKWIQQKFYQASFIQDGKFVLTNGKDGFVEKLAEMLTGMISDEIQRYALFYIEFGKLEDGNVKAFAVNELAQIEATIWENLSDDNEVICHEVESFLEERVYLNLEQVNSNWDSELCATKCRLLIDLLLKYLPDDSCDESRITETTMLKKFCRFAVRRLQLSLNCTGKCNRIEEILQQVEQMNKTDPEAVLDQIHNFYMDILEFNDEHKENKSVEKLLDYLENTDFIEAVQEKELYYHLLYLLMFVQMRKVQVDPDKCQSVIAKIQEEFNKTDNQVRKLEQQIINQEDDKDKLKLLRFRKEVVQCAKECLDCIAGDSDYPTTFVLNTITRYSKRWKKMQELIRNMDKDLTRFRSKEDRPLYVVATIADQMQMNIINQLNPLNVDELTDNLVDIVHNALVRPRQDTSSAKYHIVKDIMRRNTCKNFPFTKEADVLLEILWQPVFRPIAYVEIVPRMCSLWLEKEKCQLDLKAIWEQFAERVKNYAKTRTTQDSGLARVCIDKVLDLAYGNPTRLFLLRLLEKLSASGGTEIEKTLLNCLNELKVKDSQSMVYRQLIPEFNMSRISDILLLGKESNLAQMVTDVKAVEEIFCTQPPSKWEFLLEKLVFTELLKDFFSLMNEIEQQDDLFGTLKIARLTKRQKMWLKLSQRYALYQTLKCAYFLTEDTNRISWLQLMRSCLARIQATESTIFGMGKDFRNFFKFSTDLDFQTFEKILKGRFPSNWLKSILKACILQDVNKSRKSIDEGGDQIVNQLQIGMTNFTNEISQPKIEFMFLLHCSLLNAESDESFNISATVVNLFEGLCTVPVADLQTINDSFKRTPFSYWLRRLRYHKFQSLNLSKALTDKLFGMDEPFGEKLVDKFIAVLKTLELGEHQVKFLLTKFCSCEWILDENALNILRKKDLGPISIDLEEYTAKTRKHPLVLDQLVHSTLTHRLNVHCQDELKEIRNRITCIQDLLKGKYKVIPIEAGKLKTNIKAWIKDLKKLDWRKEISQETENELIAIIYRGIQLDYALKPAESKQNEDTGQNPEIMKNKEEVLVDQDTKKPRNTQLIALLLLIGGKGQGRMGEIETGEGKSCIVAMFAAFCAIQGAHVHVITSNKVLAQEDQVKFTNFYSFFDLKVSNNCDQDCGDEKKREDRYNKNIVYGELGGFQADLLNTEFHNKTIVKKRDSLAIADVLIVDEVDSLLLDKGANMLYLSHDIPELKYLRSIFLIIWQAVQLKEVTPNRWGRQYSANAVNSVRKAVQKHLEANKVLFPDCLQSFVSSRLGIWVKQAFRARFMPVDEDFIVSTKQGKVVNMDKDTGVQQGNMQLSLGLQQFLQLRFRTKLSAETLKCVFISNHNYFTRHKTKIFGITGTLGDEAECRLLSKEYGVTFFGVPRFKVSGRIEKEAVITNEAKDWSQAILNSIEQHNDQPILIVCESIAKLGQVKEFIKSRTTRQITEYADSESDQDFTEKLRQAGGLDAKRLLISTNLAGRGTDLEIAKSAHAKGLHVILTFLPPNIRVEKQAFGRTARAGAAGSVQFVIQVGKLDDLSIDNLKERRKICEEKRIEQIRSTDIPKIKIEDELFRQFSQFRFYVAKSQQLQRFPKRIRTLQLKFLDNRWSVWLDSIRELLDILHLQEKVVHDSINKKFEKFKRSQLKRLDSTLIFAEFTSELTQLAVYFESVATKGVVDSTLKGQFGDAGEIMEEYKETVCDTFSLNPLNTVNRSMIKISDWWTRPSEIQLGLSALEMAHEIEARLSDSTSIYSATLKLQLNPFAKPEAKKCLVEARDKIERKMIENVSCIHLLDQATDARKRRDESAPQINKFLDQINSENNLLQFHLDAIATALHCPITMAIFKAKVSLIDSDTEAQEIFDLVTKQKFIKTTRWSKKLEVRFGEDGKTLKTKCGKLMDEILADTDAQIFSRDISKLLLDKIQDEDYELDINQLEKFVITKTDFLRLLAKYKVVKGELDKEFLITISKEKYNAFVRNGDSEKKIELPEGLRKHQSSIAALLLRSYGMIYDGDKLFGKSEGDDKNELCYLQLTNDEKLQLREILARLEWIEETDTKARINDMDILEELELIVTDPELTVDWDKLPEVAKYKSKLNNELIIDNFGTPLEFIEISQIPFPTTTSEGVQNMLKCLMRKGIVKEPRVRFSGFRNLSSYDEIQIELAKIHDQVYSEEFTGELKKIYKNFRDEKENNENSFKKYQEEIYNTLVNSVGTLKRFPKIRVNYHELGSVISLDNYSFCEELDQLNKEGLLNRIFTFDEQISWYENKATLIVLLGAAEIAAGVALETVATCFLGPIGFGIVSPLASFLISEGGSDIFYGATQLWAGQRFDSANYWEYKKKNMIYSALTLGYGNTYKVAKFGGKMLVRRIGIELMKAVGKAGFKVAIFTFIEENINRGISNNVAGLSTLLDGILNEGTKFQEDLQEFRNNCEEMRDASFEKKQVKEFLNKLLDNAIATSGQNSSAELQMEQMMNRIIKRLTFGIMKNLVKNTLPIQMTDKLAGLFGSNEKVAMNCANEIQEYVNSIMESINKQVKQRTSRLKIEKEICLNRNEKLSKDEFVKLMEYFEMKLKMDLKKGIADYIYQQLCTPTIKRKMHQTIMQTYAACTEDLRIGLPAFEKEPDMKMEDGGEEVENEEESNSSEIVSNARGRTCKQVSKILGEQAEFYRDNYGHVFVNLRNDYFGFAISTSANALDDYLDWKNSPLNHPPLPTDKQVIQRRWRRAIRFVKFRARALKLMQIASAQSTY